MPAACLLRQALSSYMPGLGTLLCSKMTLGKFIVLDQPLSVTKCALHTILSTKSVHKGAGVPVLASLEEAGLALPAGFGVFACICIFRRQSYLILYESMA